MFRWFAGCRAREPIQATATQLPPQAAADKLVALANYSRGPDNISVIIARRIGATGNSTSVKLEDTNA